MSQRPRMPVIFVCSPYRGDVEQNTARAIGYCRYVIRSGGLPYAPHLFLTRVLNDDEEYERTVGLELGLEMLKLCDGIWVFGQLSKGMRAEVDTAKRLGIPIRYFDAQMKEVAAHE